MYQSSIFKNERKGKSVARLVRLETYLADGSQEQFYTGFSGRIKDGGIFITTWQTLERYTPVEVAIHFPDGRTIFPRGTVEWIREMNPAVPDMAPGIGVSFLDLQPFDSDLLESWLLSHPPVFLDNIEISPLLPAKETIPDNIELDTFPLNIGPHCDLDEEQLFLTGLARDVTHYLNERPMAFLRKRIEEENRNLRDRLNDTWTLRIVPPQHKEAFHGGFAQDDPVHRVFVCTTAPPPIGTTIRLQLICENGTQLGCMAEVRWIRKSNPLLNQFSAPAGMGVVLKEVKDSTWQAIGKKSEEMIFCEAIRTPF